MKNKKLIVILLAALVLVFLMLVLRSRTVLTGRSRPENSTAKTEKVMPTVLVTKDKDGYGLQFEATGFEKVRKVEMLVKYLYRGKENPSLVASGAPQQNSYWAHFRFESCSRNDCVRYKTDMVDFRLTLNYDDGESREYKNSVVLFNITQKTPLKLN